MQGLNWRMWEARLRRSSPPRSPRSTLKGGKGEWGKRDLGKTVCDLCSCVVFQEAHEAIGASSRYWQ